MVAGTPPVWQGRGSWAGCFQLRRYRGLHPQPRYGVLVLRGSQARLSTVLGVTMRGRNGGKWLSLGQLFLMTSSSGSTCPILQALCGLRAGPCPEGLRKAKKRKEEKR